MACSSNTMVPVDALFRHIDQITRCRRRVEIEVGAIRAIHEMLAAQRTALYKVFMPPGDVLAGLSAEIGAAGVASNHDDGFSWPAQTASIESYPHLQACFGGTAPCASALTDGGQRLVLPVHDTRHEPYAFLQIERAAPFAAADLAIVQGFADLLRNCLALLDYGETDTLTRLLNRKTFDEYLINILANIPRQDDALSGALHLPQRRQAHPGARDHWLGVMDIDRFKSINDRFGHLIGDEVLILIADLMRESFRAQDKLFRFGGEEFVALLRPAEYAHASATFERFRQQVAAHVFPQVGQVTVSIGYTRIRLGDTPSAILDAADEALYWGKANGRNQCNAYETLVAAGRLAPHPAPPSEFEFF